MIVQKPNCTNLNIGISDYRVSNDPNHKLLTYSLGSCLGVTAYDPVARVGGMVHCQLPMSTMNRDKADINPAMFVDTGIPMLFEEMYSLGAEKSRIILKAAGCSNFMDPNNRFNIGERNAIVLRKLLWKNSVMIAASDLGGHTSRTLSLEISSGLTEIKSDGAWREFC